MSKEAEKEAAKAAKEAAKAAKEAAKAAKEAEKDSVTVVWRGKARTYTRSVHGDTFAALAKEFADKVGGTVK